MPGANPIRGRRWRVRGQLIEGFCYWDSWNRFDESDWVLQMNRALSLVRSNKIVICQSYPEIWDVTNRMFATAAYLLIKGARTYLNLVTTGDVALEYYPEYTIDLGGAASNVSTTISNLWHSPWGVYRRHYTNGIVLANPGAIARNIANLGANYLLVSASGDGDEQGNLQEYIADTNPTNASSYFHIEIIPMTNAAGVTFGCSTARLYSLQRNGELAAGPWLMIEGQTNRAGEANGTMCLIDTNIAVFQTYRVRVGLP